MQGPFRRSQSPDARPGDVAARPIAATLGLGPEHTDLIDRSHERCRALGLSRIELPDHARQGRAELALRRERSLRLHLHAAPVMELLHEQIANTHSMVVLTDAGGTVLLSIGDEDFLARAQRVALAPGADWSEAAKGTNAVGTALFTEQPTLVHADEHYLHANHFLTCSAAPIVDPRGNVLGVLDVSGDHRSYHRHTMGLVKMSARMIENHWLSDESRHGLRLHFHARVECIGTLMEGILVVEPDGRIAGANRGALEQLGLDSAAVRRLDLAALFGLRLDRLVDHFRSPLALPLEVRSPDGRPFHVHARFHGPAWAPLVEAGPAMVTPAPAPDEPGAQSAEAPAAPTDDPVAMPEALAALARAEPALAPLLARLSAQLAPVQQRRLAEALLQSAAPSPVAQAVAPSVAPPAPGDIAAAPAPGSLQVLQQAAMEQALAAAGGNVSAAARSLGISRNTLYRKLRWRQDTGPAVCPGPEAP